MPAEFIRVERFPNAAMQPSRMNLSRLSLVSTPERDDTTTLHTVGLARTISATPAGRVLTRPPDVDRVGLERVIVNAQGAVMSRTQEQEIR